QRASIRVGFVEIVGKLLDGLTQAAVRIHVELVVLGFVPRGDAADVRRLVETAAGFDNPLLVRAAVQNGSCCVADPAGLRARITMRKPSDSTQDSLPLSAPASRVTTCGKEQI